MVIFHGELLNNQRVGFPGIHEADLASYQVQKFQQSVILFCPLPVLKKPAENRHFPGSAVLLEKTS
jgi:hypothetical protein